MEPQRPRDPALQIRRKLYMELSQLVTKLIPPSPFSLSRDELRTLHIQCSAMTLCPDDDPDSGPLYCKLVPQHTMNKAFDSTFTSNHTLEWPGYDPELGSGFYAAYAVGGTLLQYTMSGYISQERLVNTEWCATGDSSKELSLHRNNYPDIYGQWGIRQILRLNNTRQPHLACVHIDDALPEDGLHASEMISAIKLMKQGMRLDKRGQFRIYPVYVYSFSCHKARILETFYNAGTFFVKKTPWIDFAEENRENIKLYLRWMMSEPSGLTTFARKHNSEDASDSPK